jgi:hypothetical protein
LPNGATFQEPTQSTPATIVGLRDNGIKIIQKEGKYTVEYTKTPVSLTKEVDEQAKLDSLVKMGSLTAVLANKSVRVQLSRFWDPLSTRKNDVNTFVGSLQSHQL